MKDLSYYRSLPYTRRAEPRSDDNGTSYFVASVSEIPALRIDGDTKEEALLKLDEVFDDFIESMIQAGDEIAEPALWPANLGGATNYRPRNVPAAAPSVQVEVAPKPWTIIDEEKEPELTTVGG